MRQTLFLKMNYLLFNLNWTFFRLKILIFYSTNECESCKLNFILLYGNILTNKKIQFKSFFHTKIFHQKLEECCLN